MTHGICPLSIVPVRREPTSKSEQLTQLLFGELFTVLGESENKLWLNIQVKHDFYEGWVEKSRVQEVAEDFFTNTDVCYTADLGGYAVSKKTGKRTFIPLSSALHKYDQRENTNLCGSFLLGDEAFEYHGTAIAGKKDISKENLAPFIEYYMQAPYLWGGRHPLGIDCSGLVQNVMRLCGLNVPRDSYQQAEIGTTVDFVQEAQYGDVAFFDNEEGRINHVGIVVDDRMIVHAAECTKLSRLDHQGIFDLEKEEYSHKLRIIKRYSH